MEANATQQQTRTTPRDYQDSIAVIHTHPKHGTWRIVINDANELYMEPIEQPEQGATLPDDWSDLHRATKSRPVTILRVPYSISAHLIWNDSHRVRSYYVKGEPQQEPIALGWLVTPGGWHDQHKENAQPINFGWRQGLYMSRADCVGVNNASSPAKAAAIRMVEEVAESWQQTEAAESLRIRGAIRAADQAARTREEEIEKAEKVIATNAQGLAVLNKQIADLRESLAYVTRRTAGVKAIREGVAYR